MTPATRTIAVLATILAAAVSVESDAPANAKQRAAPWKLAFEHYDPRVGEGGTGIDIVTSRAPRPLALASRPRGSSENFSEPQISPDGAFIAYRRVADQDELYVVRDDGTDRRRLASGQFHDYLWSTDGDYLAFVAACGFDAQGGCRAGRIDVVRRDGTRRRVLHRPGGLSRAAEIEIQDWSRRGDLLYIVRDRGRATLYRVDADGLSAALANSNDGGALGEASWSGDGTWIAYTRRCVTPRTDTYCDIAVMNREGGMKRLVWGRRGERSVPNPSHMAPTWILGSRRMLFSLWGDNARTRSLDLPTGESRVFSRMPWHEIVLSRDGTRVATIDDQLTRRYVLVTQLNGSVVERTKLHGQVPGGWSGDHHLWIG